MNMQRSVLSGSISFLVSLLAGPALADSTGCSALPTWSALKNALASSITPASGSNGGLGFNMWGTLVANDGTVCAVAFSGRSYTDQWLGSRVISAQKANTAPMTSAWAIIERRAPACSLAVSPCRRPTCSRLYNPAVASMACSTAIRSTLRLPTATTAAAAAFNKPATLQARSAPRHLAQRTIQWLACASAASTFSAGGLALYSGGAKVGTGNPRECRYFSECRKTRGRDPVAG
jgi:hypothetical protein